MKGTEWQATILDGSNIDAKGESYTLVFGPENKLSGMGDCNRIMGGYSLINQNGLEIKTLASTRMFCPDQEMETRFIKLLESVDSYTIDGNNLMLLSGGDIKIVLTVKK